MLFIYFFQNLTYKETEVIQRQNRVGNISQSVETEIVTV